MKVNNSLIPLVETGINALLAVDVDRWVNSRIQAQAARCSGRAPRATSLSWKSVRKPNQRLSRNLRPRAGLSFSRFHFAAAAALAVVVAVAGALFLEDRQQANALAEQASENASLVHTIKSLKVRLDAIDSTMSNAGLTDLRQSVGEIRSNLASTREVSGALAQLSQRVDKLDHEASAKVDKLTERVDHEANALTTGLSTRIDKLEQKIAAPLPAPSPVAQAKQPPTRPKFDNVSMDRTSSIERSKPLLRGYVVLDARDDVALVGGTLWRA